MRGEDGAAFEIDNLNQIPECMLCSIERSFMMNLRRFLIVAIASLCLPYAVMGQQWRFLPPTGATFVHTIQLDHNANLFVSTVTDGIFKSTNFGDEWIHLTNSLKVSSIFNVVIEANGRLVTTTHGGVFFSDDSGSHWVLSDSAHDAADPLTQTPNHMLFCASQQPGVRFGSYCDILRSTNDGSSWERVFEIDTTNWFALIEAPDGSIIVGGDKDHVRRSTDHGATWPISNTGLKSEDTYNLALDSSDGVFLSTQDGIYRSLDNGQSWTATGLPHIAYALETASNGVVYAGTDQGLWAWRSTAGWQELSVDTFKVPVTAVLPLRDGRIVIGMQSGELLVSTDPISLRVEQPTANSSFETWPNPCNSILHFSSPESAVPVVSSIYSIIGRQLITAKVEASSRERQIDVRSLPAGIYSLRLSGVGVSESSVFVKE